MGPRIVFYSVDSVGLGHLSRSVALARAVLDEDPDAAPTIVAESADTRVASLSGIPAIQVVPHSAYKLQPQWRRLPKPVVDDLWIGLVEATLGALRPDLVVFDTYVWRKVKAVVRRLGTRHALVFRGYPRAAEDLAACPWLTDGVGLVVLPHRPDDPLVSGLPPFGAPTVHVGPIIRRTSSEVDLPGIRRRYGLDAAVPTIVVSDGGGNALAPDDPFVAVALEAGERLVRRGVRLRMVLVAGPLRSRTLGAELPAAPGPWATVVEYEHHLVDLFAAADVVVCRGGYNSVAEVRHLGVPAVAIAAGRRDDDQEGRLQEAMASSDLHVAEPDPAALAELLAERIAGPRVPRPLPVDGAIEGKRLAARRLLELATGSGDAVR